MPISSKYCSSYRLTFSFCWAGQRAVHSISHNSWSRASGCQPVGPSSSPERCPPLLAGRRLALTWSPAECTTCQHQSDQRQSMWHSPWNETVSVIMLTVKLKALNIMSICNGSIQCEFSTSAAFKMCSVYFSCKVIFNLLFRPLFLACVCVCVHGGGAVIICHCRQSFLFLSFSTCLFFVLNYFCPWGLALGGRMQQVLFCFQVLTFWNWEKENKPLCSAVTYTTWSQQPC